jgi:CelD/BcsL family acetyltransferase involved in cellulose biosynthesis
MSNTIESMQFSIVSEVDDEEWRKLIGNDPRARLFHEPWVLRAFARHLRDVSALWMELRSSDGRLCAGLPIAQRRRGYFCAWSSGPGGTYGGPVIDTIELGESADAVRLRLLHEYSRLFRFRVVRRELVFGHEEAPAGSGLRCIDSALLRTDTDFEDFLRQRFPKNRRNECTRSERRGMRVRQTREHQELAAFHVIYAERSQEWGAELLPLALMWELLRTSPSVLCFVAEQDGAVVGGHICVRGRDELFAWVGTTRRMAETFPSSLLVREEARYACAEGLSRLNLGSSLGISGVQNYKRLMGAESRPLWVLRREAGPARLLRRGRGVR